MRERELRGRESEKGRRELLKSSPKNKNSAQNSVERKKREDNRREGRRKEMKEKETEIEENQQFSG